ncbi:hypothetical protein U6R65_12150 [Cutibacterium acnes]
MKDFQADLFLKELAPLDRCFISPGSVGGFLIGYVDSHGKVFYLMVDDDKLNHALSDFLERHSAPVLMTEEEIIQVARPPQAL